MDPLSISASIAGLIGLADPVFRSVYKYVRSAKNMKKEVEALASEINKLIGVLRMAQAAAEQLEEAMTDGANSTREVPFVKSCAATLDLLNTKTEEASAKKDKMFRHLTWPFSASRTKELLGEVTGHVDTINMVLTADSLNGLQLGLSKMDGLARETSLIKASLKDLAATVMEIHTRVTVDAEKASMLQFFMKSNPENNFQSSVSRRHDGTGEWLVDSQDFTRWLETPGSKLWLNGIPGAGKTIMAGYAIQLSMARSKQKTSKDIGVCFFFCNYTEASTLEPVNILGALACHLAKQKKEALDILQTYYDELNNDAISPRLPDIRGLSLVLVKMSNVFDQIIVIADGLDECGDNMREVSSILANLAKDTKTVSMGLFSRDNFDIKCCLHPAFDQLEIAAAQEDVRLFVSAELETRIARKELRLRNLRIKDDIRDELVNRSHGMSVIIRRDNSTVNEADKVASGFDG
jgi:hypothetical protein